MDEKFKKKYGIYDGIDTSTFKHIPEISFYNNNYFVGLKRDKNVTNDLLFAHSDDDNQTDWYVLMSKIRLILRFLLIPLWLAIFIVYLPIWYIQMSWYYFNFGDYWDSYLVLWDRVMLYLKLKKEY